MSDKKNPKFVIPEEFRGDYQIQDLRDMGCFGFDDPLTAVAHAAALHRRYREALSKLELDERASVEDLGRLRESIVKQRQAVAAAEKWVREVAQEVK